MNDYRKHDVFAVIITIAILILLYVGIRGGAW